MPVVNGLHRDTEGLTRRGSVDGGCGAFIVSARGGEGEDKTVKKRYYSKNCTCLRTTRVPIRRAFREHPLATERRPR